MWQIIKNIKVTGYELPFRLRKEPEEQVQHFSSTSSHSRKRSTMTVKKSTRCGGHAALLSRQRLQNANQQIDMNSVTKPQSPANYNIIVGFNEKDQLELKTKEDSEKSNADDEKSKLTKNEYGDTKSKIIKSESIKMDDITNCVNVESYPNCENTLVFYSLKNHISEAIALKFENEQDFKRIYFTYKYFKMRNRLTKTTINTTAYASSDNLYMRKNKSNENTRSRKDSMTITDGKISPRNEYNLMQTTDNNGVTHISVQQKFQPRFDQPMSLINLNNSDLGEIDSIIYTDVDIPVKPQRRRLLFSRLKTKAPLPPSEGMEHQSKNIMKGQFVRVNVDRMPDVVPKEIKLNKIPDVAATKDSKNRLRAAVINNNSWSSKGYESDLEEWRTSRSQFSTSAFDSLARPNKLAMAFTLRKPQTRPDIPYPQYYRIANETKLSPPKSNSNGKVYNPLSRIPLNNFLDRNNQRNRQSRVVNVPDVKRALTNDHRKFSSLQNLDMTKKNNDYNNNSKRNFHINDVKKPTGLQSYSNNITTRLSGLTNKLKELSQTGNTLGRLKPQAYNDVTNLKPVIKKSSNIVDGLKKPVVRTCSAEPPKKVTFSAFATVQVV